MEKYIFDRKKRIGIFSILGRIWSWNRIRIHIEMKRILNTACHCNLEYLISPLCKVCSQRNTYVLPRNLSEAEDSPLRPLAPTLGFFFVLK